MPDMPILETEIVAELQDIMGDDFTMLVQSFQRDGEQRLAALHRAQASADADTLRRQAHSFKGSSGNLGARRVSDLCLNIEQHASAGELEAIPPLLEQLDAQFSLACSALNDEI
ncbi:MAG: Hpt domain-containing protein [Alcanivorax sp.]|nr:Hpt domain-containing protein [Alcanivorax sp.]